MSLVFQKVVLHVEKEDWCEGFEPSYPGDFCSPLWIEFQCERNDFPTQPKNPFDLQIIHQQTLQLLEMLFAKKQTFWISGDIYPNANECLVFDFSPKGEALPEDQFAIWRGVYHKDISKVFWKENMNFYESLTWLDQKIKFIAKSGQPPKESLCHATKYVLLAKTFWHLP